MGDIYARLVGAMAQSSPPFQAEFYPEGALSEVITRSTIQSFLFQDENLKRFILRDAMKLFAICLSVQIRQPQLEAMMIIFRKHGFSDSVHLPVHDEHVMNELFPDLPWSDLWQKKAFLRNQWSFVAYKFSLHREGIPKLEDSRILPFLSVEELSRSEQGNYATIYNVVVAPSHLDPEPGLGQRVCPSINLVYAL